MPTNEQGEHADFDGPGNRYSIGIEMCENRGNNRAGDDRPRRAADRVADVQARDPAAVGWCRTTTGRGAGSRSRTRTARTSCWTTAGRGRKWKAFQRKVQRLSQADPGGRMLASL